MVLALVDKAREAGVNVQPCTRVLRIERDGDGRGADAGKTIVVHTDRGAVRCDRLVHCTNAWCGDLLPELQGKVMPIRNHVVSTAPLAPLTREAGGSAFGLHPGFVYWVQREDGRVILGGFRDLDGFI